MIGTQFQRLSHHFGINDLKETFADKNRKPEIQYGGS